MADLPGFRDVETCNENHKRFVQRVVQNELVFALQGKKGIAFSPSNDAEGTDVLLFWSDAPYAKRARLEEFSEHQVHQIGLFDFLFRWLSGMEKDGVLAGTNWTADLVGLEISPPQLKDEILAELGPAKVKSYLERLAAELEEQKRQRPPRS